jgi:hypothetical protein
MISVLGDRELIRQREPCYTVTASRGTLRAMRDPVRVPRNVLEELESVRRYTRVGVLDIPTLRYVAMETHKPALVNWIDGHAGDYARGLLDGFQEEDQAPA